jgi:hypothetical protein
MLLAMAATPAATPAVDTALYGKSGTIYGNNVYDNLESQGTRDIYKGSTTSWKPSSLDDAVIGGGSNKLPTNDSQLKHIFRNAEGHLPDTLDNRSLIESVGNNPKNFIGTDARGTNWYAQIQSDGSQIWVRTYNGTVTNAGVNTTPRTFDPQTGLNFNPFK